MATSFCTTPMPRLTDRWPLKLMAKCFKMGSDAQLQAQRDMNLTLSLSANFDDVFPRPVFQTQIGKLQLQTTILVLKFFDLLILTAYIPPYFAFRL